MEVVLLEKERNGVNRLKNQMLKNNATVDIFRAKPCRGAGEDRSVYLYRWYANGNWIQGQKFWGGNHKERCDAAIAELQQFMKDM